MEHRLDTSLKEHLMPSFPYCLNSKRDLVGSQGRLYVLRLWGEPKEAGNLWSSHQGWSALQTALQCLGRRSGCASPKFLCIEEKQKVFLVLKKGAEVSQRRSTSLRSQKMESAWTHACNDRWKLIFSTDASGDRCQYIKKYGGEIHSSWCQSNIW